MAILCNLLLMFPLLIVAGQCFHVTINNITDCNENQIELGGLTVQISKAQPFDQRMSGKLVLPMDLEEGAVLEYKVSVWDSKHQIWKLLYIGQRSVCQSLVKSLPYQNFADETSFPNGCPILQGVYEISDYPISGQYVVLNTVNGVDPLVEHQLRLLQNGQLLLCRIISTTSHEE